MKGRGKNNAKRRAVALRAQQGGGKGPDFARELSTDPEVVEDPIYWHNELFPRKNTPEGWLVQWIDWDRGWDWFKIPEGEWDGYEEGWRREGEKWFWGYEGKNPWSGERVRISRIPLTKLGGVGHPTGSASNNLDIEFCCEGPGCTVKHRNR